MIRFWMNRYVNDKIIIFFMLLGYFLVWDVLENIKLGWL